MEARVGAILARLVCVLLGLQLLFLELGAEGRIFATEGEASAQAELPLCDFKHHNIGVDCSGWPLVPDVTSVSLSQAEIAPPAASGGASTLNQHAHPPPPVVELPPCTTRRQTPGFDCWPPMGQPPALCDLMHQKIEGIDCFAAPPAPAAHDVNHVETADSASGSAGDLTRTRSDAHVPAALPPCDFIGAIPSWNCDDPRKGTLPPCDFEHRRPGFDCVPRDPASAVFTDVSAHASSTVVPASGTQISAAHDHQQWPELPPCNFPGAIPGWDCYDPPKGDLPPCDFKHQRPGFDCWPSPPPALVAHRG